MTTGPAMRGDAFTASENVLIVEAAPHSAILPSCSAFVTHCGHGSVMRALSCGVPLVALPMGRDQDDIAARIVHRGVGLKAKPAAGSIARQLEAILHFRKFRAAAERLSAEIRSDVARDPALGELETIAPQKQTAA